MTHGYRGEYWLSFHSDCSTWMEDGTERHVLRPLPSLDFKVLKEDGLEAEPGECGELYLSSSPLPLTTFSFCFFIK